MSGIDGVSNQGDPEGASLQSRIPPHMGKPKENEIYELPSSVSIHPGKSMVMQESSFSLRNTRSFRSFHFPPVPRPPPQLTHRHFFSPLLGRTNACFSFFTHDSFIPTVIASEADSLCHSYLTNLSPDAGVLSRNAPLGNQRIPTRCM